MATREEQMAALEALAKKLGVKLPAKKMGGGMAKMAKKRMGGGMAKMAKKRMRGGMAKKKK